MITIHPGVLEGSFMVPPSKSITHRALLLAAHSDTPCRVAGWLDAEDPRATLAALGQLGAAIEEDGPDVIVQHGTWRQQAHLDCRNAGTALRLLMGLAARLQGPVLLDGDASLRSRPNAPLVAALRRGGARIDSDDHAPLRVQGPIRPGPYGLPGGVSSQYASSLMLTLPFLDGDSTLTLDAPVTSAPYLEVTRRVAQAFGLATGQGQVHGGQRAACRRFVVEGDWSAAAFPFVAAAITGGTATVPNVDAGSAQGDRAILDVLTSFGARVQGPRVQGGALVSPGTVDVAATPDLFPALCILAACAEGVTTFSNGGALRHKESDRIAAMADGLAALGIQCKELPDGLVVHGGRLTGGTVDARGDHRIHMAFAIAGLAATGPVTVSDPGSAAISYPRFHDILEAA